jgi:hypothetical protein
MEQAILRESGCCRTNVASVSHDETLQALAWRRGAVSEAERYLRDGACAISASTIAVVSEAWNGAP